MMSAIFGIFDIHGGGVEECHVRAMRDMLLQYGHDAEDFSNDSTIAMGCCLNRFGVYSQNDVPVYHDEGRGIMLVGDALIYNRAELFEKCGLDDREGLSTQALLLDAYLKWGEDCPKYINGDFAFAVWEKRKSQLFIARDHLGVRPLYYFFDGQVFAFATDYRALLCLPFVGRELDEVKLYSELSRTYHIDPEATFFEHIKKLPQANTLRVGGSGIQKTKYWTPGTGGKIRYETEEEYAKALYGIVDDAIRIRVNGVSGKIGAELSGGLDSSVITILANRELKNSGCRLEALFSWSPPWELLEPQPGDERELIEAICRQEGLRCGYYDPTEFSEDKTAKRALLTDGGSGAVLCRELRAMSSQGIRFVLSGWGGDQGISHRANLKELFLHGCWGHFLSEALYMSKGSPLRFAKTVFTNTVLWLFGPFSYIHPAKSKTLNIVQRDFRKTIKKRCKRNILYFTVDPIRHIESGNIQTRTELAAWVDAEYNMQHLFPFLDHRVMDFAMSVPRHWYFKRGLNRYIYRRAFRGILPDEVYRYMRKDDPGRGALLKNGWTRGNAENLKSDFERLNKERFFTYLDFDKLREFVGAIGSEPSEKSRLGKRSIGICLDIQRILEDAEGGKSECSISVFHL